MERNPNFWAAPLPNAERLTAKVFGDEEAMVAALEAGTIDIIYWFPLKHYPRLKDKLSFVFGPSNTRVWELRLPPGKAPFNNKKVRQAMAYAIDRESVVTSVLNGVGAATPHPWGKTHIAYDPAYDARNKFDLDRAKAMLTEAGAPTGRFSVLLSSADGEGKAIATILQADLRKIGWVVELELLEPARFSPRLISGDFQMAVNASGQFDLYTSFAAANSAYRPQNNPLWPNGNPPTAYSEGIRSAERTIDPAAQKAAFRQVADTMLDEAWTIPIAWQVTVYGSRKQVEGIEVVAVGRPAFEKVNVR